MSFLTKARIFAKNCNFIINSPSFRPHFMTHNVKICASSPIGQFRSCSSESDAHIKTIYEGKLNNKIKYVKIFSLSTSILSISVQPYIIPQVLAANSTAALALVVLTTGIFALGTPFMLNLITSKYVTRIKYDSKKNVYIASVYNIFVQERKLEFIPDDVTRRGLGEIMTTCYIHDRPLFFDAEHFTEIDHYSIIMGYDKPIDFELEDNPKPVPSDKSKNN